MGDSMGTKEAANKWGCSQATVRNWCLKGMVAGAPPRFARQSMAYTERCGLSA